MARVAAGLLAVLFVTAQNASALSIKSGVVQPAPARAVCPVWCGQCVGTRLADTVFRRDGCDACPASKLKLQKVQSWQDCKWPETRNFSMVGRGAFFNLSLANPSVPSSRLRGLTDMPSHSRSLWLGRGLRVMVDLDDTVHCSGGRYPKGIDTRCKGTTAGGVYPGVAEFTYALSLGLQPNATWGRTVARSVIPFTARPLYLKWALGLKACDADDVEFRKRVCGCPGRAACLAKNETCACFGFDVDHAQYGAVSDMLLYTAMGHTKFRNWMEARKGWDTPAVFIGDNGQGDLQAAQMMLTLSQLGFADVKFSGRVLAAFIHDVAETCQSYACRAAWAVHNVFFFADYYDAATIARARGIISADSYSRVAEAFERPTVL